MGESLSGHWKIWFLQEIHSVLKLYIHLYTAGIKINGHLSKTTHLQEDAARLVQNADVFIEPLAQLITQETILEGITIKDMSGC